MSTNHDANADLRPAFRVAVFGLAQKFQRVLEIVLRHARHNQYRFELAGSRGPGEYDIALVDMTAKGGKEVANTLRRLPSKRPIVTVGRRTDAARGRDDLLQNTFTMNVLKTLNAVVDGHLARRDPVTAAGWSPVGAMPVAAGGAALQATMLGRPGISDRIPGGMPLASLPTEPPALDVQRRARALIVDDSPTVRRQLSVALAEIGLDCEAVASAEEALDTLTTRRYDVVFVDVVMPDMDGYRLTREIKRERSLRGMPIVILTSRSSPFDLARGALAGCSSYLVKPISLKTLRATVERHLRRSAARGAAAGPIGTA
jgi:CheY-like chemotaxis protein